MPDACTEALRGDITRIAADAIVNAANTSLLGGGSVDGAIHRAGGSEILEECRRIRARQSSCRTGQAVSTTAVKLPAKDVIHTVWRGGRADEDTLPASAFHSSLRVAVGLDALSVAFPNISTGIYGFPKEPAAGIAVRTVDAFLSKHTELQRVCFVCFDEENLILYQGLLRR